MESIFSRIRPSSEGGEIGDILSFKVKVAQSANRRNEL